MRGVDCPGDPTTLNLRLMSVPAPLNASNWKPPTIKWPELVAFDVTEAALLRVPVLSIAGDAGVTTAGSNDT